MGNEVSGNLGGKPGAGQVAPRTRGSHIRGRGRGRGARQNTMTSLKDTNVLAVNLQTEEQTSKAVKASTKVALKPDREGRPIGNLVLANLNLTSLPASIDYDIVLKRIILLDLSLNPFDFSKDGLPQLPKLKKLIVWGNNMKEFPYSVFKSCPGLESIDFGHNHISNDLENPKETKNFKEVKLDGTDLNAVPLNFLKQSDDLKLLDLRLNSIKILPAEISNFSHLKYLYLSCNRIKKLPNVIGKLNKLVMLDAAHCEIEEIESDCFSGMHSLEMLWLYDNKLSLLPASIASIKNLTELLLQDNQLKGLPEEIGALGKLKELNVANNKLSSIPRTLSSAKSLTILNASNNDLRTFPRSITELVNLDTLNLSGNKIIKMPKSLHSMKRLKRLNLAFNYLGESDDPTLSCLKGCTIAEINLSCNRLKLFPKELANLPDLQIIRLCHNFLSEDSIPSFENAKGNLPLHIWLTGNLLKRLPIDQFLPIANRLETFCCSSIIPMEFVPEKIGMFENLQRMSCTIKKPFNNLPDECMALKKLNRLYFGGGTLDLKKKKATEKWQRSRNVVHAMMPNAQEVDLRFTHPDHINVLTGSEIPSFPFGLYQITGMGSQRTEDTCHVTTFMIDEDIQVAVEDAEEKSEKVRQPMKELSAPKIKQESDQSRKSKASKDSMVHFVAVFDGHGGRDVSECAQANFAKVLKQELKKMRKDSDLKSVDKEAKKKWLTEGLTNSFKEVNQLIEQYLLNMRTDELKEGRTEEEIQAFGLTDQEKHSLKPVGATATIVVATNEWAVGGNVGDSRSMLVLRKGKKSTESKPKTPRKSPRENESTTPRQSNTSTDNQPPKSPRNSEPSSNPAEEYRFSYDQTIPSPSVIPSQYTVGEISRDHKPHIQEEIERIRAVDGYIVGNLTKATGLRVTFGRRGRLLYDPRNTAIGVCRALGDFFASPGISPEPYIEAIELTDYEEAFAIVASDGLWDIATNEQVLLLFEQSVKERLQWKKANTIKKEKRKAAKQAKLLKQMTCNDTIRESKSGEAERVNVLEKSKSEGTALKKGSTEKSEEAKKRTKKKKEKLDIDDLTAIAANLAHFAFGMGSGDDTAVVIVRLK